MDQESCFTSETLGRLEAGLAPDLIPSAGAIIPRGREEKPGNRDPLSLFLLKSHTAWVFSEQVRPISHVARSPSPSPLSATFGIKIASPGKQAMLHGGKQLLL